jgi:hypothetical protein
MPDQTLNGYSKSFTTEWAPGEINKIEADNKWFVDRLFELMGNAHKTSDEITMKVLKRNAENG